MSDDGLLCHSISEETSQEMQLNCTTLKMQ